MKNGRNFAESQGVKVLKGERVIPVGDAWLICDEDGFAPCPWAFELAHFCTVRPGMRVLDLGTGTGVLLIALSQVCPELAEMTGIELNPRVADQARRNLTLSGLSRQTIHVGDLRDHKPRPRFDLVIGNPPFYPPGWGRLSDDETKASATHALNGDVGDFAAMAAKSIAPHGEVIFVFDGGRSHEVLLAMGAAGLTVKAIRFLNDDRGLPARVLVRAAKGGAGARVDRVDSFPKE